MIIGNSFNNYLEKPLGQLSWKTLLGNSLETSLRNVLEMSWTSMLEISSGIYLGNIFGNLLEIFLLDISKKLFKNFLGEKSWGKLLGKYFSRNSLGTFNWTCFFEYYFGKKPWKKFKNPKMKLRQGEKLKITLGQRAFPSEIRRPLGATRLWGVALRHRLTVLMI